MVLFIQVSTVSDKNLGALYAGFNDFGLYVGMGILMEGVEGVADKTHHARITDLTQLNRGLITVRHNGQIKECKVGDVRRHMSFLCFLAALEAPTFDTGCGWAAGRQLVEDLAAGHSVLLGWVWSSGVWHISKDTPSRMREFSLLQHFGHTLLRLENIQAIRYGVGMGTFGKLSGYDTGLVLWWHGGERSIHVIEQTADANTRAAQRRAGRGGAKKNSAAQRRAGSPGTTIRGPKSPADPRSDPLLTSC